MPPPPAFQAYKIAETRTLLKNLETKIDLYQLSHKDGDFLDELEAGIKIKNLVPNLDDFSIERWQEMLNYAIGCANNKENKTFLAVKENRPCGILTCSGDKNIKLDCICTFPIEIGKKVKFAGKTLFQQLFKHFQENKAKKLSLDAITNGPFDNVKKYTELGFKATDVIDHEVKMETDARKVKETLKRLDEIIDYTPVKNSKDIDLRDILYIS